MPEIRRAGRWVFRRDPRITTTDSDALFRAENGLQVLRPEIQLLYKAKDVRAKDEADFGAILLTLRAEQRAWLVEALTTVSPNHPWIGRMRAVKDT